MLEVVAAVCGLLALVAVVVASICMAQSLPRSGGNVNGTLNMNGNDVLGVKNITGAAPQSHVQPVNELVSSSVATSVVGHTAVFSSTDGLRIADGGSPPFIPSAFNSVSGSFSMNYTLGTPISGSGMTTVTVMEPPGDWKEEDTKVTYLGPSGRVYNYGGGCGFQTDTAGTYLFRIWLNDAPFEFNLNVVYAPLAGVLTTGSINGTRIFTTGDTLQLGFDKGSDIAGSPVVTVFGMGWGLNRTA